MRHRHRSLRMTAPGAARIPQSISKHRSLTRARQLQVLLGQRVHLTRGGGPYAGDADGREEAVDLAEVAAGAVLADDVVVLQGAGCGGQITMGSVKGQPIGRCRIGGTYLQPLLAAAPGDHSVIRTHLC